MFRIYSSTLTDREGRGGVSSKGASLQSGKGELTLIRIGLSLYLALILMMSIFISPAATAASEPAYSLTISSDNPEPGSEITVTVKGENFEDVYAYEVNLEFDTSRLAFKSAKADQESGFSISPIVKGDKIQFAHTKVGQVSGDSGTLTLCTFTFEAIDSGQAQVALKNVKLVNSQLASSSQMSSASVLANVANFPEENGIYFKDILHHWAKDTILDAVKKGFVDGYPDHTFRPDNNISRAEFVTMLLRALHIQPGDNSNLSFADLSIIPEWSRPYVSEAVQAGIITGYEDQTFRPARPITRAELAVMIVKALGLKVDPNAQSAFADASDIPDWAVPYVATAADAGLIQGRDGHMFAPNDNATRAEAVKLIMSMLNYKGVQGAE